MPIELKGANLLLIEDDIKCVESSSRLLSNFGMNILHAKNTIEAYRILEKYPIDLVISDIFLENSHNGLELIDYLRQCDIDIPVIVISGCQETECLLRSIRLNLTAYLIKPIHYDGLLEVLRLCSKKMTKNKITINRKFVKNNWFYDIPTKSLVRENVTYKLNRKEVLFIEMVLHVNSSIITKDMFYEHVWEYKEMSDAALKNFILRIRKRFGKDFIEAMNAIGYRFVFYYCIGFALLGRSHSIHSYLRIFQLV
jgi:DNA-binding response OmpR family regulator